jgi:hypothetical protein
MNQVGTQECASTFARLLHETGTRFLFDPDGDPDFDFDGARGRCNDLADPTQRVPTFVRSLSEGVAGLGCRWCKRQVQ